MIRRTAQRLVLSALLGLPSASFSQCVNPPVLETAIKKAPSSEAYNALGAYFAQKQRLDCALPAFEHSVKLNAASWEARFNYGLALMSANQPAKAEVQLRQAVRYKPDSLEARNALGLSLQALGRMDDAEGEFNKSLQLNPQSGDSLARLGELYSAERRYSAAIEKLSKASALSPADPDLKIELAVAYSDNGNAAEAIKRLSDLTLAEPNLARAHFNLATVYANEKRFREAADEYGATLKLEPENDVARLSLVKAYSTIANFQASLPLALEYVSRRPKDYEGHYMLGNVYRGLAEYPEAEHELKIAIVGEDEYGPNYDLGFVLGKEGKQQESTDVFTARYSTPSQFRGSALPVGKRAESVESNRGSQQGNG